MVTVEELKAAFRERYEGSADIRDLQKNLLGEGADYPHAHAYAVALGELLAGVFGDALENGLAQEAATMELAEELLRPMLNQNYDLASAGAVHAQEAIHKRAGMNLRALTPPLNTDRINGIVKAVAKAELFADAASILGEPVVNLTENAVDETIRTNAQAQHEAGLNPRIIRRAESGCCEWCRNLAGSYLYYDEPEDVFRRHNRCRCLTIFAPGEGKVQDVWTKRWTEGTDSDRIKAQEEAIQSAYREKRKEIEAAKRARQAAEEKRIPTQLSKAPGRLASKTPTAWKQMLEEAGEKVVPLSRGHFKGVPYEEGGGWKVNFGGNGILSFHPAEHSHHKGAYYKISTPKEGTRRYDLNGIEIKG